MARSHNETNKQTNVKSFMTGITLISGNIDNTLVLWLKFRTIIRTQKPKLHMIVDSEVCFRLIFVSDSAPFCLCKDLLHYLWTKFYIILLPWGILQSALKVIKLTNKQHTYKTLQQVIP